MKYYSAIQRNKILPSATIWIDLEGIMLTKISHTEKDKYHMISLMCGTWKTKQNKTNEQT